MRVETPEGVLVVYDAAAPPESDEGCSGYMGYWLSARDKKQYIFPAVLQAEGDLATVLLALERDLGVDLEALADTDERIDVALRASTESPSDEIVWEPATLHRAVEIMGFDAEDELAGVDEPNDGGVAALCEPCFMAASLGPPRNCGSPGDLAREAFAVTAGCCSSSPPPAGGGGGGGGGGGPCGRPCCAGPCNCPGDKDCDGRPNGNDPDVDDDNIPNGSDPDVDGYGIPNGLDSDVDGDVVPNRDDGDIDGYGLRNGSDPDFDGDGTTNGSDGVADAQPACIIDLWCWDAFKEGIPYKHCEYQIAEWFGFFFWGSCHGTGISAVNGDCETPTGPCADAEWQLYVWSRGPNSVLASRKFYGHKACKCLVDRCENFPSTFRYELFPDNLQKEGNSNTVARCLGDKCELDRPTFTNAGSTVPGWTKTPSCPPCQDWPEGCPPPPPRCGGGGLDQPMLIIPLEEPK